MMIMLRKGLTIITACAFIFLMLNTFAACDQLRKRFKKDTISQAPLLGYDINHPQVYKLPHVLNEISGLCFNNGNPDSVYAEEDENGKVFRFKLGNDSVAITKFAKHGDYEDIQILNGHVILLKSNGMLYEFPLSQIGWADGTNTREFDDLLPDGEFESLYADSKTNQLYILCKHCEEKQTKVLSGYVLSVSNDGNIKKAGDFTLDVKDISKKANDERVRFRPSAFAKNEATGDWYIVSSINKMIVVTDNAWHVKNVYILDGSFYNQPEGIAFDKNNTLYLSNERGISGSATIMKIPFNK